MGPLDNRCINLRRAQIITFGVIVYTPQLPRYSDSLLIEITNTDISTRTYSNGDVIGKRYSSNQYIGEIVYKVGITTGKTSGAITGRCVTSYPEGGGVLYCQMEANYEHASGDSGAPVYHSYRNEAAVIYGIHWGGTETIAGYSPIDGIEEDLGIVLDIS